MEPYSIFFLLILLTIGVISVVMVARRSQRKSFDIKQEVKTTIPILLEDLVIELVNQKDASAVMSIAGQWVNMRRRIPLTVFYQYDAATHELTSPLAIGNVMPDLPERIKLGLTIFGEVARNRFPSYIADITVEKRFGSTAEGMSSALIMPLLHNNALVGIMAVYSEKVYGFSSDEQVAVERIAEVIASLVANSRYLEESNQTIARFDRFQALVQRLNVRLDSKQLLHEITAAAREMLDTQMSILLDFLPESDELRPVAWSGINDETAALIKSRMKEDLKGMVAWARQPARTPDLRTDQRTASASQAVVAGMLSELAVPILYGEKLYGILAVETNVHRYFTDDEMNLLSALAAQAGVAIRNAQLFERLQASKNQLEQAVADLEVSRQQADNARIVAVEANRLKTEFVNNMSHELRTPLNAVINFTRVVIDGHAGPINPQQVTYLNYVREGGEHLLGLINDILDLAKIESGRMELRREMTMLEPILKGVLSTAIGLTKNKNIAIQQDIMPGLPALYIDATRVRQILLNLLSNAAKFTEQGTITLRAGLDTTGHVLISVEDTGIGIRPEDIPTVFEEFRQIDGSLQRTETGTGLGMPISKRFVELHGGTMWLDSELGKGTTVYFTLPVSEVITEPAV